jgi:hypothetical protein
VAVTRERVDDVRRVLRRDVPVRHRGLGRARNLAGRFRPNEGVLAIAPVAEPAGSLLAVTNQRVIHVPSRGEPKAWEIRDLSVTAPLPTELALSEADEQRLVAALRSTVLWHQRNTQRRPHTAAVSRDPRTSLCDLLALPHGAGDDAIRAAYRVLSQIFHPDRHAGASAAVRDEAARRMRDLNVAYSAWRAAA